jgi:hypothetical protein
MSINIARTIYEGRSYEIIADSDHANSPTCLYYQVYRLRKDGTRGRRLMSHREEGYTVWSQVRDEIKKMEDSNNG